MPSLGSTDWTIQYHVLFCGQNGFEDCLLQDDTRNLGSM